MQTGPRHPGHSVLQVAVPALEEFVRGRYAHYDPAYVSTDPAFSHAHVTVLGPFVDDPTPADIAAVAQIAASTEPFGFVLDDLHTFADGLVHLRPEPAAPFDALTARVHAAFPDHPPYAGRFEVVVAHLTLDVVSPEAGVSVTSTRAALGPVLPARCRAERLDLAWYEPGGSRLLASWPLGGGVTHPGRGRQDGSGAGGLEP